MINDCFTLDMLLNCELYLHIFNHKVTKKIDLWHEWADFIANLRKPTKISYLPSPCEILYTLNLAQRRKHWINWKKNIYQRLSMGKSETAFNMINLKKGRTEVNCACGRAGLWNRYFKCILTKLYLPQIGRNMLL